MKVRDKERQLTEPNEDSRDTGFRLQGRYSITVLMHGLKVFLERGCRAQKLHVMVLYLDRLSVVFGDSQW